MVIAMVHSLRGVVSGQVMRRGGVLGRAGPAPLAEGLLGGVGAVDVVADHPRLAGLGHGHVEDPAVVLGGGVGLRAAGRRADLMRARLRRVMVGDSGDIGDSGLKAAPSRSAAADAGGGRGRLSILVEPEEQKKKEGGHSLFSINIML